MSPTKRSQTNRLRELKGFILPEKKEKDDEGEVSEEEHDEEEQQPEFLDTAEMDRVSSGGHLFHSSLPRCEVKFRTFSEEVYNVQGRFALRSPWWEVTCLVKSHGSRHVVKGFPSYKLRSDLDRQEWIGIVSLFLKACKIEDQYISMLFQWLPPDINVSLYNLMEVLDEFSEGDNKSKVVKMITTRLSNSVPWMQVHASCLYPGVMQYLPTLLPRQFTELLGMGKKMATLPATQAGWRTQQADGNQEEEDISLLNKLENIIANNVWMLGFSAILYREVNLVRCEAQLRAFEDCYLFEKIPLLQRHSLLIYNELKRHCRSTGSTYMVQEKLTDTFINKKQMSDEQAWSAIHFLKTQSVLIIDKHKVVLQNFNLYETGIAQCLRTLVDQGPWNIPVNVKEILQTAAEERKKMLNFEAPPCQPVDTSVPVPPSPSIKSEVNITEDSSSSPEQQAGTDSVLSPIKLDEDHVRAAANICSNPVTIISGKAGSGKTTVVSQLFRAAVLRGSQEQEDIQNACADYANDTGGSPRWDDPPVTPKPLSKPDEDERRSIHREEEILLTAPTGRAASLLSKKTGFKACTLHQVLYSFMNKEKDEEGCPRSWKFRDVRILVVDEGSMVSAHLLHSVLSLLTKHAELRKLIILGDVRQLPSVEPGNILNDLFYTLKRVGWAVEMRTNHRSESQLIVDNAACIADMGMKHKFSPLEFDATVDLNGPYDMLTDDKRFILIRLPKHGSDDDLQRAVKFLITNAPGLSDDSKSQFITFKRSDVALINEICCKHYNNHLTKKLKNKLDFQLGDKVCCTRNGNVTLVNDRDQKGLEGDTIRLCNGEIFFIRQDNTKEDRESRKHSLTLDAGDNRPFTVDYKDLQEECKLQHAWARTIHTFQGSENETIVYVVGGSWYQTWKHIYTAITRGQKRVYVVAKEGAIKSAICQCETPRNTRLGCLVKDQLLAPEMLLGTPPAQPNTPQGTPSSCGRQQFTPLPKKPNVPCKRLWKADGDEDGATLSGFFSLNGSAKVSAEQQAACEEEMEEDKEWNGAAASVGNVKKRKLSAEQEVLCKQPYGGSC